MFNLFESLFILALDAEEGEILESVANLFETVLTGAVLAELVLENRIALKDKRIIVIDQSPIEHPVLDKALFEIIDSSRPRKIRYWINTLTYKKCQQDIVHHLVEKAVLTRVKKRLRFVIPCKESTEENGSAQSILKTRIKEIVFSEKDTGLDEKVLLAFVYHADFLKLVFKHGDRKTARKRIKKLLQNDEGESILGEALEEILALCCNSR